jgi:hypothetical protein
MLEELLVGGDLAHEVLGDGRARWFSIGCGARVANRQIEGHPDIVTMNYSLRLLAATEEKADAEEKTSAEEYQPAEDAGCVGRGAF